MSQGNNIQEPIQEQFGEFVERCVMNDGNLLTKETDKLFTDDNIQLTRNFLRAIKPLFDKKNEAARDANKKAKKKEVKTWGIGDIFNGSVFRDDFKDLDYKGKEDIIIEILLHCNWLMYLCSDRQHKQNKAEQYKDDKDIAKYFNVATEWAIGATFSSTSLDAMLFILELILEVRNPKNERQDLEAYIEKIENLCNKDNWKKGLKWSDNNAISTDAIVNVILFFCNTEKYLPIPAQNNKESIYKKLGGLVKEEYFVVGDGKGKILDVFENEADANNKANEYNKQNNQQEAFTTIKISELLKGLSDIDKDLYKIRMKLRDGHRYEGKNPFWNHSIRPFWDDSTENLDKDQLSDRTLLEYKKAMILYGPPGTSKSYQARKMAEGMIAEALRKKGDIANAINQLKATLDSHIHILQMHPNYTYDDFIIGKSIGEKGKIIVKPGKMLQIIKEIEQDDNIPHFVILDEINRVDISRVFGELFTAMEASYRDKGVELSVDINDIPGNERTELTGRGLIKIDKTNKDNTKQDGKLYLKVPKNMYFIGTMNMIDFSLEQVDFALRRRFLWRLSTYDADRLDEIISEKIYKDGTIDAVPDDFSKTCTDLNNEIEWENSLGKSYLIGHAFFSEIVDIVKQVKEWGNAKNILWQVSILPTLEAYCGTMDANMQEDFLTRCKDAFMPKNDGKKQNK